VSVVIPTRDRRTLVRSAVACALAQHDVDVEVVVVDDASSDGTAEDLGALGDPRVRVVRHDRRAGVSAARNRGIAEATAPWVAFLDDDDLWAPDKLVRQLDAADRAGRAWVYAGDVNVDDRLEILSGAPPAPPERVMSELDRFNPVPTGASNVVVRADLLAAVGGFDPALRRTEDWDLWIRLARSGAPAAADAPLVAYRFHPGNRIVDVDSIVREPDVLAARYRIEIDRRAVLRRAAWMLLRAGRRVDAARYYGRAAAAGDARSLLRAAVALAHPAAGSERLFTLLPTPPGAAAWRAEARRWLDDLKRSADVVVPR
jgi:glycosyltransferase involved in cell wall biosynthesis